MNQRDSQLHAGQRGNNGGKRQKKTWHPKIKFKAKVRICDLLRGQSSWTWMSVMLLMTLSYPVLAQPYPEAGTDVTPGQMRSGSLLLRMKSGYVIATRLNTDIQAQVSGLVARVTVSQSFRNDGKEWVEGIYVFPLPDTAAIDGLRMRIGERVIEGEIREREQAK